MLIASTANKRHNLTLAARGVKRRKFFNQPDLH
jgi:hypothetical protein